METQLLDGSLNPYNIVKVAKHNHDFYKSHPTYFRPEGLLIFCGEQGSGKTLLITGALEKLGNFLIEGLKSLFIPSDGFFKDWFDDMYQFFTDRLGFLMLPVDLLVKLLNLYLSAGSGFAGIPFPEFKWLDGTVIIPAQTVQFDFLQTDWGKNIQTKLYFVGNVIMIGALINLMHRKMEEVLRG